MADDNIERIPINDLRQEQGAHELMSSPDMGAVLGVHKGGDARPRSVAACHRLRTIFGGYAAAHRHSFHAAGNGTRKPMYASIRLFSCERQEEPPGEPTRRFDFRAVPDAR